MKDSQSQDLAQHGLARRDMVEQVGRGEAREGKENKEGEERCAIFSVE